MVTYEYFVNLDERGEFSADVRLNGRTVFEIRSADELRELIDDGYMRHGRDIRGLHDYMKGVGYASVASSIRMGRAKPRACFVPPRKRGPSATGRRRETVEEWSARVTQRNPALRDAMRMFTTVQLAAALCQVLLDGGEQALAKAIYAAFGGD